MNLNEKKDINDFVIPSLSKINLDEIENNLYSGNLILNYKSTFYKISLFVSTNDFGFETYFSKTSSNMLAFE